MRCPLQKRSRRMDTGRKDGTHQRSHPEKYAPVDRQDPNTDNPYVHRCILEIHTQQTERSVWCVHVDEEEHRKHNQTNEALNNQGNDQKDARKEYHSAEQQMAGC